MIGNTKALLTDEHLADYERLGYIDGLSVLSGSEVEKYRAEIDRTLEALGGQIARLDAPHHFFEWGWDLSTHPRILDYLEPLIGPDILLKSSRLFYKPARSGSFVGWHQDGWTDRLGGASIPGIWLGLTDATVENGCLRVVPESHHLGIVKHIGRPRAENLTGGGTEVAVDFDEIVDVVMKPGEMSLHHPLVIHGSNPNRSDGPRIGLSVIYFTSEYRESRDPIAVLRGNAAPDREYEIIEKPRFGSFEDQLAAFHEAMATRGAGGIWAGITKASPLSGAGMAAG